VVKYFFYFRSWEIIACLCMRTAVQFYCYGSARRRKSKWYCTKEGFKISDRRARIGWTFWPITLRAPNLNPSVREKLKEATQSERIAIKKAAMASFFTKKSEKTQKKSDDSSNEKTDSLILFSGVDLLFNGYDEAGFRWKINCVLIT